MKQKLKIGLIGCGAIGTYLAKRIDKELSKQARLVSIFDINALAADRLRKSLRQKPTISDAPSLINKSTLIIEATNVSTCKKLVDMVISSGKDILIMSVGALLRKHNIVKRALKTGSKIYIPSGAIAGIDAFMAAGQGTIRNVQLVTRKPARTLVDVPYVRRKRIHLKGLKKEKVLFRGNAQAAIANFPKNINVAALLSLATWGAAKTKVKIVASPNLERNIHEIEVRADCGRIITRTENVASAANPKTSYLAMLSAFATIKGILSPIKIGT